MNDTQIFGKTVSGSFKACVLYVAADACMAIGQACFGMSLEDWNKMWWMQKVGWAILQLGGSAILIKAFYSKSAIAPTTPTTPV